MIRNHKSYMIIMLDNVRLIIDNLYNVSERHNQILHLLLLDRSSYLINCYDLALCMK